MAEWLQPCGALRTVKWSTFLANLGRVQPTAGLPCQGRGVAQLLESMNPCNQAGTLTVVTMS